jgi:hypothetical protein
MRPTLDEIDNAITEAEAVRSRHDGVHVIHSCVTVLRFCRTFLIQNEWSETASESFDKTLTKVRCIDRTGFWLPSAGRR